MPITYYNITATTTKHHFVYTAEGKFEELDYDAHNFETYEAAKEQVDIFDKNKLAKEFSAHLELTVYIQKYTIPDNEDEDVKMEYVYEKSFKFI